MHGDIYHYDVNILPECPRVVNHKVIRKLTLEYEKVFKKEKPVFDGKKNIYSKEPLPIKNDGVSTFDILFDITLRQFSSNCAM